MKTQAELAARYTELRPLLTRVAYAVLGSHSDAEDVVSECWLRLIVAHRRAPIRNLQAWATVAVSRRALDVLNSERIARETYVGPWLPEPLLSQAADPADRVTLDDTVNYALLVVLETLTPAERTSWVLHDLFGMEFSQVAAIVGRTEAAVRQLASRARKHVADGSPRTPVSPAEHRATTEAFALACAQADIHKLLTILDPDVTVTSDGGGQVVAARRPVHGSGRVAAFLLKIVRTIRPAEHVEISSVNDAPGLVVRDPDRVTAVISLTVDSQLITRIDIIRAPNKLTRLN